MIRPAVQSDGGDLVLESADVETGVVKVTLVGSCSSCAISETTLKAGIERILTGRLSWVTAVVGDVDESIGYEDSYAMGRGSYVPKIDV
ncbi:MAG: NifU family protein [Actinomycetota bacterium]|nr:MAG: NifU family protein [Actinomycetota bacterium]